MSTRNYNTISPSARALLLMKGYTPIPYARRAAELILAPDPYVPEFTGQLPGFWARVMHFEARYSSIDQMLSDLLPSAEGQVNILELSSGFSFRGLALVAAQSVHYIDTDLPEVIAAKQPLVDALVAGQPLPLGHYELRALNALDEVAFNVIIDSFPPGELIIVNEGLLMYLNKEEKQQLGALIRKALLKRGGYWITADIYLNRKQRREEPELAQGDTLKEFLDRHNVDANMFESFEEATQLFTDMGFALDKESVPDYTSLSALPHFMASASPELLGRLRQSPRKIHATWRLKPTI